MSADRIDIIARADRITGRPDGRVVVVVHEGEPVPKERARGGQHGHYTPSRTRAAEAALALVIKAALRGKRFEGNVAVVAVFHRSTRRRCDADNLLKTAMDAATKAGAWIDDSQATAMAAWVELDRERPRTVLAICEAESSLERAVKPKKRGAA